ncbi:hypothetical protein Aduo_006275 [Ancylostoma duodenale]
MSEATDNAEVQKSPADAAAEGTMKEKEVSTDYGMLEERIKELFKCIGQIRVVCEKEVSKAFRLGDARKEAVVGAVEEQTNVVSEKLNSILCEYLVGRERDKSPADSEVIEILREAELTTAEKLERCLDRKLHLQHVIQKLSEMCECTEGDLVEEVLDIKQRAEYFETKWREACEVSKQLQFQVDSLAVRVKKMGNPRKTRAILTSESTEGETDKEMDFTEGERCSGERKYRKFVGTNEGTTTLQDRPMPSKDYAVGWTPKHSWHMHKPSSRTAGPHQSDTGAFACGNERERSKREEEFTMKDFMLAATVPDVKPFFGRPTESFKRFLKSFLIKYPRTHWDDNRLVQLLESFLRKEALTIFETLPRRVKEGSFDELVRAMKERLDERGHIASVKALATLRTMRMKENQTVSEFCYALERVASQAYPDEPREGVSLQMAEILYSQLSKWTGSYILAETIETSPRDRVYEQVKDAALRLERNLQRGETKFTQRRRQQGWDRKEESKRLESTARMNNTREFRDKPLVNSQNEVPQKSTATVDKHAEGTHVVFNGFGELAMHDSFRAAMRH